MVMNLHEYETCLSAKNSPCGRNVEGNIWIQVKRRIRVVVAQWILRLRYGLDVQDSNPGKDKRFFSSPKRSYQE
jgi:hypothetical protein